MWGWGWCIQRDNAATDEGEQLFGGFDTRIRPQGFFNTDQMNAQIAIRNPEPIAGPAPWEIRFNSNYSIDTASAGVVTSTDNGDGTFAHVIAFTTPIPGFNNSQQISITGTRHPLSLDLEPLSNTVEIYI